MRVACIGDFFGRDDEGMRKISRTIAAGVEARHEVLRINTREAFSPGRLRAALYFRPQIVHYLTGPTLRSLGILFFYRRLLPGSASVASAVRPFIPPRLRPLIRILKPDVVLTQDPRWEKVFMDHEAATTFLPNGVDLERFRPTSAREKAELRQKYNFPPAGRIALHVGHLRANRNLEVFTDLQKMSGWQAVVAGSTAFAAEAGLCKRLEESGCLLLIGYYPQIEELYACADAYIFPVCVPIGGRLPTGYNQSGVIDLPLSVLEAMAIGLPVATTRLPTLERLFQAGPGLRFFNGSAEGCRQALADLGGEGGANREKVLGLDWPQIISRLEQIYVSTLAERRDRGKHPGWTPTAGEKR